MVSLMKVDYQQNSSSHSRTSLSSKSVIEWVDEEEMMLRGVG